MREGAEPLPYDGGRELFGGRMDFLVGKAGRRKRRPLQNHVMHPQKAMAAPASGKGGHECSVYSTGTSSVTSLRA